MLARVHQKDHNTLFELKYMPFHYLAGANTDSDEFVELGNTGSDIFRVNFLGEVTNIQSLLRQHKILVLTSFMNHYRFPLLRA